MPSYTAACPPGSSGPHCTVKGNSMMTAPTCQEAPDNSSPYPLSDFPRPRPPNSLQPRRPTASFIAASEARNERDTSDNDSFSQIPIPGLGRRKRRHAQ